MTAAVQTILDIFLKLSSILKKLKRVGIFNYVFENNSLKGLFGQNAKKVKISKLSRDSRYLQKLALNNKKIKLMIKEIIIANCQNRVLIQTFRVYNHSSV